MLFCRFICYITDFAGRCACQRLSHDILSPKKGGQGGATIINRACQGPPRTGKDPCLWSLFGPWAVLGCKYSFAKSLAQPNANHCPQILEMIGPDISVKVKGSCGLTLLTAEWLRGMDAEIRWQPPELTPPLLASSLHTPNPLLVSRRESYQKRVPGCCRS